MLPYLVVSVLAILAGLVGWLEYLRTCRVVHRTNGSPEALEALGKAAAGFWKYRWRWRPKDKHRNDE